MGYFQKRQLWPKEVLPASVSVKTSSSKNEHLNVAKVKDLRYILFLEAGAKRKKCALRFQLEGRTNFEGP